VHPVREEIPVYLAAIGPKNLELTGEIADGWLAIFFSPENAAEIMAPLRAGRESVGKSMDGFDVVPTVPVVFGDDVAACADPIRPYSALYIGGMGSREKNFYNQLATRMGYEAEAIEIQDKYLAREYRDAWAAVPMEFAEAGVTTLTIAAYTGDLDEQIATLRTMVDVLEASGLAT
jgi:alkanesulfonate monooxygenase SsuD/methylene tetrahydromethanopterin reductase-like flavin-dependent oxidoreductase (luciferase family)